MEDEADEFDEELIAAMQMAIAEADVGLGEPMDIEAIKAEVIATIEPTGQPKAIKG